MLNLMNIPKLKNWGNYKTEHCLKYISSTIKDYQENYGLELCPDFQRGHVWTEQQQVAYVEFILRGGRSPDFLLNHPGWMTSFQGDFVVVDGLQRLTALQMFLEDGLCVFGKYTKSDIKDIDTFLRGIYVTFYINTLKTKAEVLEWYLELNSAGTVHTKKELNRVKQMLEAESLKLYLVFVKDGVMTEECYLRGHNYRVSSPEQALVEFNKMTGYNLTINDVNISEV